MNKYYKPLDFMMAATIMFREGDPVTASSMLAAAIESADFDEAIKALSYAQQEQRANEQFAEMEEELPAEDDSDIVMNEVLEEGPAEVSEEIEEAKLFALASKIVSAKQKRKAVAAEKRAEMSLDKPTNSEAVSRPSGKVDVTENTECEELPGRKETAKILANLRQLRASRKK